MAKGQQRSNKEKKKPKQDKKKLPPAPSPLSLDQRAKPGQGGGQKKPDRALIICATALHTRVFAHLERVNATGLRL